MMYGRLLVLLHVLLRDCAVNKSLVKLASLELFLTKIKDVEIFCTGSKLRLTLLFLGDHFGL